MPTPDALPQWPASETAESKVLESLLRKVSMLCAHGLRPTKQIHLDHVADWIVTMSLVLMSTGAVKRGTFGLAFALVTTAPTSGVISNSNVAARLVLFISLTPGLFLQSLQAYSEFLSRPAAISPTQAAHHVEVFLREPNVHSD